MTTWHRVRRVICAVAAGVVAAGGQRYGLDAVTSIVAGLAVAVLLGGLIIPALWKPPDAK